MRMFGSAEEVLGRHRIARFFNETWPLIPEQPDFLNQPRQWSNRARLASNDNVLRILIAVSAAPKAVSNRLRGFQSVGGQALLHGRLVVSNNVFWRLVRLHRTCSPAIR